jgi:hypothetical protein
MSTSYKPTITVNQNIPPIESIMQHAGNTHSLSLISMSMLDPSFKSLIIDIKYDDKLIAMQALEHVIGVWSSYKPIKTRIRSYKQNNVYLNEMYGIKLEEPTLMDNIQVFKGYKVVIDIEETNETYLCKIYRELENGYRTFKIDFITI